MVVRGYGNLEFISAVIVIIAVNHACLIIFTDCKFFPIVLNRGEVTAVPFRLGNKCLVVIQI